MALVGDHSYAYLLPPKNVKRIVVYNDVCCKAPTELPIIRNPDYKMRYVKMILIEHPLLSTNTGSDSEGLMMRSVGIKELSYLYE